MKHKTTEELITEALATIQRQVDCLSVPNFRALQGLPDRLEEATKIEIQRLAREQAAIRAEVIRAAVALMRAGDPDWRPPAEMRVVSSLTFSTTSAPRRRASSFMRMTASRRARSKSDS